MRWSSTGGHRGPPLQTTYVTRRRGRPPCRPVVGVCTPVVPLIRHGLRPCHLLPCGVKALAVPSEALKCRWRSPHPSRLAPCHLPPGEGFGDGGTDCHVGALPLLAMTVRGDGRIPPLRGFSPILPNSTKRAIISSAHGYALALPVFGRREAPSSGGGRNFFPPPLHRRGVMQMVTYSDLIQIGILVVSIINLFLNSKKK